MRQDFPPVEAPMLPGLRRFRIVAFGTSLTELGAWQTALGSALARLRGSNVEVWSVARCGANSDWGIGALSAVESLGPDVVLIEFASNDAALHRGIPLGRSYSNIRTMADRLAHGAHSPKIYLMAMSPMLGLRRAVRPFLNRYFDSYAKLADELGVGFIDHRPGWAGLPRRDLRRAIPDGAHPLPDIASRIIVPAVLQALGPNRVAATCG